MEKIMQPHISRIHIENFRNFVNVDFEMNSKIIIIGENNTGKSNLIYAIQLILDPTFSDEDRLLNDADFNESIVNPAEIGAEIKIDLYIDGYEHVKNILCQLSSATVDINGEKLLKISYKYYQHTYSSGKKEYSFLIFKGNDETRKFTYEDRKYLNVRVIKALRDVEKELKYSKSSPVSKLIKTRYDIPKQTIEDVSASMKNAGMEILKIPEIHDLQKNIDIVFNRIVSYSDNQFNVSLNTMDIDANRLLNTLKLFVDGRDTLTTSLGINNILYVAMVILMCRDNTIKSYLSNELYTKLKKEDKNNILEKAYQKGSAGYTLIEDISSCEKELYDFLYDNAPDDSGVTILVVEEPEAHLYPIYQRLLYRYIIANTNSSVLITTHSTHISSVSPIRNVVHLVRHGNRTMVHTTKNFKIAKKERLDLMRYIDVKRGEIYMAKGIIFVEGIAEEYLVPKFAAKIGIDLDRYGIIICNINSTNFIPYRSFTDKLGITNVIITDGDPYLINDSKRVFTMMTTPEGIDGYDGNDRMKELCKKLYKNIITDEFNKMDFDDQDLFFKKYGIFIGINTLEIDIFDVSQSDEASIDIIAEVFSELTDGGIMQKRNFKADLKNEKYDKCLDKIESSYSNIGKGRFAQRLSTECTDKMIPGYIEDAIKSIVSMVIKA